MTDVFADFSEFWKNEKTTLTFIASPLNFQNQFKYLNKMMFILIYEHMLKQQAGYCQEITDEKKITF